MRKACLPTVGRMLDMMKLMRERGVVAAARRLVHAQMHVFERHGMPRPGISQQEAATHVIIIESCSPGCMRLVVGGRSHYATVSTFSLLFFRSTAWPI